MTEQKVIFQENIGRVDSLCNLYKEMKSNKSLNSSKYKSTDVLRAAVVFLHSSFEEYFRSILTKWLPIKANDDTLKSIPIGLNAGRHPDKIYLHELAKYRDKSINEVISESVAETLKLKSFNNEEEIRTWANKCLISLEGFGEMGQIDKAVHRRHKIVHEADKSFDDALKSSKGKLSKIQPEDVIQWKDAYNRLVDIIDSQVEQWTNDKNEIE